VQKPFFSTHWGGMSATKASAQFSGGESRSRRSHTPSSDLPGARILQGTKTAMPSDTAPYRCDGTVVLFGHGCPMTSRHETCSAEFVSDLGDAASQEGVCFVVVLDPSDHAARVNRVTFRCVFDPCLTERLEFQPAREQPL